jgi:hypothetical protein
MRLTQYPTETLQTWRTGRLGGLYMNSFTMSRDDSAELSQLERIAGVMRGRPLAEQRGVMTEIRRNLMAATRRGDYGQAQMFAEMACHYAQKVISPQ